MPYRDIMKRRENRRNADADALPPMTANTPQTTTRASMTSPESLFAEQCSKAIGHDGTIDPQSLMGMVIETYRDYQARIALAEEAMDLMRSESRKIIAKSNSSATSMSRRNQLFEAALHNVPLGLSIFDAQEQIVVYNDRFLELLGISAKQASVGTAFADLRPYIKGHEKERTSTHGGQGNRLSELDSGKNTIRQFEWTMDDGRIIEAIVTILPDGRCITVHRDITAERMVTERISHLAHHDPLTGLPNRVAFHQKMQKILAEPAPTEPVALLHLNLDFFKTVNATLGASAGDQILQQTAQRLAACVGPSDVVVRLGSDEFAIVQTGARQPSASTDLGHSIIQQLAHPFNIGEHQVSLSASIGVSLSPAHGGETDHLLKNASLALSRAKTEGRKTLRFFEPEMDARVQARRALEADLRKAVLYAEFELHYQPIYDLAQGRVSTFEALLRWNHPERGRISPMDFIPLAEEMGLIVDIGRWVLYQACLDAATWPDNIKVSVNVSAIQFKSADLLDDVMSALAMAGLAPERLDLEVTESVLIRHREETLALLHDLKFHGISISLDDFGTGFSSLSYLRSFPFDKIKIDKSFVDDITSNDEALAMLRAIIFLGKSLGMAITVEGVETVDQFELLKRENCTEVQGYLISRPRPSSEIAPLLASDPLA